MAIQNLGQYIGSKKSVEFSKVPFLASNTFGQMQKVIAGGLSGGFGHVASDQKGIIGDKALDDLLTRLPSKIQTAILRRGMQQALKPFYQSARNTAPVQWQRYEKWNYTGGFMTDVYNQITRRRTGRLKKSIARKTKSNKLAGEFTGNLYVKKKPHGGGYYAHLTEFGTKGHYINNWFGNKGVKKWVKGQKAQKWMTKAWKRNWRLSLRNFQRVMSAETKRQFQIYLRELNTEKRMSMVSKVNL